MLFETPHSMSQLYSAEVTTVGLRIVDPYLIELTDALSVPSCSPPNISVEDQKLFVNIADTSVCSSDRLLSSTPESLSVQAYMQHIMGGKNVMEETTIHQKCAVNPSHVTSEMPALSFEQSHEPYSNLETNQADEVEHKSDVIHPNILPLQKSDVLHPNRLNPTESNNYVPATGLCASECQRALQQMHPASDYNGGNECENRMVGTGSLSRLKTNTRAIRRTLIAPNRRSFNTSTKGATDLLPTPPFRCGQRSRRSGTSSLKHPVVAIHPQTKRAHRFNSIMEASDYLGIPRSNIQACLKKPNKCAKQYQFREVDDVTIWSR